MTYTPLTLLDLLDTALHEGQIARAASAAATLRRHLQLAEPERQRLASHLKGRGAMLARATQRMMGRYSSHEIDDILDDLLHILDLDYASVGSGTSHDWTVLHARGPAGSPLDPDHARADSDIVAQVLSTGRAWPERDPSKAPVPLAGRSGGATACLPLCRDGTCRGFLYLKSKSEQADFVQAATVDAEAWLPELAKRVLDRPERYFNISLPGVVTRSRSLLDTLAELHKLACFDASVLLSGETGTGKSLIARQVHAASSRAGGPFIHINCGAIPETLLEGELFGSEAGAYTGSRTRRTGRFEAASGGTLFLDELEAMPSGCQAKLLVALQERTITRLGSNTETPVDVRVIAATSTDPHLAIARGSLREDLYYRVAVFAAHLLLARIHLQRICKRYGLASIRLSSEAERSLLRHPWPGNVRELENTLERSALLATSGIIEEVRLEDPSRRSGDYSAPAGTIGHLQRAAAALAEEMTERPELRQLSRIGVFRGALLIELVRQRGTADAAFRFLGEDDKVRARNHTRILRREIGRLETLAESLGEHLDSPLP